MASAPCSAPVRLAATTTPLEQFALTLPVMDVSVCELICQLTSEQFPSGRPAIVDDPHAPLNPEPPVVDPPPDVDPPPLDVPPLVEPPAVLSLPEGAVGLKRSDVCSNAQLVASVEISKRLKRERIFMCPYGFVSAHTHGPGMRPDDCAPEIHQKSEKACKALQNKGQERRSIVKTGRIQTMSCAFFFRRSAVFLALVLIVCVLAPGCRRRAAEVTEYRDPHPLPEEPLVVDAPSIGRHGGRFVMGSIQNPRELQRHHGERSSHPPTSPSGRLRASPITTTSRRRYSRSGEVVGAGARWADVDVSPAQRRDVFRRASDYGGRRALQLSDRRTTRLSIRRCRTCS